MPVRRLNKRRKTYKSKKHRTKRVKRTKKRKMSGGGFPWGTKSPAAQKAAAVRKAEKEEALRKQEREEEEIERKNRGEEGREWRDFVRGRQLAFNHRV
jgi:hypothetical protein